MTQEDKELLLKDLCARLPYGVILKVYHSVKNYINDCEETEDEHLGNLIQSIFIEGFIWFRPYLRPLSSMTEEEAKVLGTLHDIKNILSVKVTNVYIDYIVDDGVCTKSITTLWCDELISSVECLDWLNSKHFDYRGLILKGLAIEAPKGMYE